MTHALTLFAAALMLSPGVGQLLRWHDLRVASRLADEARLSEPWPEARTKLTEPDPIPAWAHGVHIGTRQPVEEDFSTCLDPCTARHCGQHHAKGSTAQRFASWAGEQLAAHLAWNTPTAEWDVTLLGLRPPDIRDLYAEVT
jgi:hypothetical protein